MIALVDCNNFYVSCERVFRPDLRDRPVVVLSNNDGCAISRSEEAKAAGIQMSKPVFKVPHLVRDHDITVISSNYALYGDMSARVMSVITAAAPEIEIYSIDEAFIDIDVPHPVQFGRELRNQVYRWTGIPVSVGIARTKTLAKLANRHAKTGNGVYCLNEPDEDQVLQKTAPRQLWGIGSAWADRLAGMQIHTAADLKRTDTALLRRRFSVVMTRIQSELRGIRCTALNELQNDSDQVICSRSFGKYVTGFNELRQAVAQFVSLGSQRLREAALDASKLIVTVNTNPRAAGQQYHQSAVVGLPEPLSDVRKLTAWAVTALERIYRPKIRYARAGIMLTDLTPAGDRQLSLMGNSDQDQVMETFDHISAKFGRDSIRTASSLTGTGRWHMNQKQRSPHYTTRWEDLPVAS